MFTPLFTDGIWNTTFNSDLKEYCDFIRKNDKGRSVSNTGGYQSNYLNMAEPLIQPLISHIQLSTKHFSSYLQCNSSCKVSDMWININGYKDYNMEHTHPNCMFSGVYYIHTPKDCGHIEFVRHSHDYMTYDWRGKQSKYNSHNSALWHVPSEKNKCYIFPSYYKHRVTPNYNKEEQRYSISFNIQ